MPDRWGDYPTWLAAIGTVGTTLFNTGVAIGAGTHLASINTGNGPAATNSTQVMVLNGGILFGGIDRMVNFTHKDP